MDLHETLVSARGRIPSGTDALRGAFHGSIPSAGDGIETTMPCPDRAALPSLSTPARGRRISPPPAPFLSPPVRRFGARGIAAAAMRKQGREGAKACAVERTRGRGGEARRWARRSSRERPDAGGAGRPRGAVARESSETPQRSEEARERKRGSRGIVPRRRPSTEFMKCNDPQRSPPASSNARASARPLLRTSACSRSGTLSATTPAPDWKA